MTSQKRTVRNKFKIIKIFRLAKIYTIFCFLMAYSTKNDEEILETVVMGCKDCPKGKMADDTFVHIQQVSAFD